MRAVYLEGRTLAEAAAVIGCHLNIVHVRARKGLHRLRQILAA